LIRPSRDFGLFPLSLQLFIYLWSSNVFTDFLGAPPGSIRFHLLFQFPQGCIDDRSLQVIHAREFWTEISRSPLPLILFAVSMLAPSYLGSGQILPKSTRIHPLPFFNGILRLAHRSGILQFSLLHISALLSFVIALAVTGHRRRRLIARDLFIEFSNYI